MRSSFKFSAIERKLNRVGGLGFRDLHLFNLALLGRQAWRLTQFKDTLCYKVLSSKYFQMVTYFGLKRLTSPRTHGRVFLRQQKLLRMVLFGLWGMAKVLIFGMIIGGSRD
ncbi:hypothetical protein PVK06_039385 [Gossypium arboreum]|uniref:Uncharacterized protein n=1 Tax=Gossypium arboreum TaxID=29729 RepID=A0ABR0N2Q7_GOSAR|nr:hypothetical protein PVK06_039385 [Gossypium arboreum]